jgi:hypothetical protein
MLATRFICARKSWHVDHRGEIRQRSAAVTFAGDLTVAHWSSWAQLAFIPVGLAWVLGWALLFLVKRVRSRPQAGNEHYPQIANAEDNNEQHGKKDHFPAPWTVEKIAGGFKVIDANGQSLAYVYSSENPNDAFMRKVLTLDEARRIASNIAKLPDLLGKVSPP